MVTRERYGEELDGGALVIDIPKEGGIELILPIDCTCMNARVFMYDDEAQELINIIQNKINARMRLENEPK